jgi:AcrR family transcriptional regulator
MGIAERRAREKARRRADILAAAWRVAEQIGWAAFSVEQVATQAELGRATVYGYFDSLEALVLELANEALADLSARLEKARDLGEALDVPVRFSQQRPAAFAVLFPPAPDPRPHFASEKLAELRGDARGLIGRLQRLAERSGALLPDDARSAAAFVAGISMAGAFIPELRASTTLRHRWQDFCLKVPLADEDGANGKGGAAPH